MDFTGRLVDNFFRRWYWYLLPVVLIGALGFMSAGGVSSTFRAESSLNASRNPLVEEVQIRGAEIGTYESPAAGTARLINEQLRTNAFLDDVAERAGLAPALEAGLYTRDDLRASVGAAESGQSVLKIAASWEEPNTALALVNGTINAYQEYLNDVISRDSVDAIDFWREKESLALEEAERARSEYLEYVGELNGDEPDERSPAEELTVSEMQRAIDDAQADVVDARNAIDTAELAVEQAASETGRILQVIDAAEAPTAPESVRRQQLITLVAFLVLGAVVGGGALLISTALDRSVRSVAQLSAASSIDISVAVPDVKGIERRRPAKQPEAA